MVICGLKLTHDGAVSVVQDNQLVFCVEIEKLKNNPRYASITDNSLIGTILEEEGLHLKDIDRFVVDGWGGYNQDALAIQPRLEIGPDFNRLSCWDHGEKYLLNCAQYEERNNGDDVLHEKMFSGLIIDRQRFDYSSFLHVTGHIASAYCTSPFAQMNESSFVFIWDGGMYPRLYYFNCETKKIENLGPIFLLIGNTYTIFSQHFGPFKVANGFAKDSLSIAGKVMAYIGLGKVREELFVHLNEIYRDHYSAPMGFANVLATKLKERISRLNYSDEDVLATFHQFIEELLITRLRKKISRFGDKKAMNLCIAGGCGLNIKWNSAIRQSGLFRSVYVPPFPNDSGSAIGMACGSMITQTKKTNLTWSVFSGPHVKQNNPAPGWRATGCSVQQLAVLLHETHEPVVVLNHRAELGPRALGNRSILASPVPKQMKSLLNKIKVREEYRPVSPICLEEDAAAIFTPGVPDPFMLFDHRVKDNWITRIPGVIHLDGTARLQTVSKPGNPMLWTLLNEYKKLSGIPVLCNTSANGKEKGFFPDVYSATLWGETNYVWCNDTLYEREEKLDYRDYLLD